MVGGCARARLACLTMVLLVVGFPGRVFGLDPGKAFSQYIQTNWTTETGLPQTSVYSIAQTKDGFLWVGTEQGLARFDGVRFVVFNRKNTPALPANYVHRLLGARDGSLWIGTDAGLTHLEDGVWTTYSTATGLSGNDIAALAEGSDGSVWVGTDQGLDRWQNGKVRVWHSADGLPGEQVTALQVDAKGLLWVATQAGLARFDGTQFTAYTTQNGLPGNALSALALAPDGAIWAATTDGQMARETGGAVTAAPVQLPHNDVDTMLFDLDGNLWIGFQNQGLARLHDGVLTQFDSRNGLPGQSVEALLEDAEHNVWVGFFDGGLLQLRNGKFTVYGKPEGITSAVVCCSVETSDGAVWLATAQGELTEMLADGSLHVYTSKDGLPAEGIHSMLLGHDGTIWIGHRHGVLTRYQNGHFDHFQDPQSQNHAIDALLEDKDGQLWIGTYGSGVARFADGQFDHVTTTGDVPAMAQGPDGALWVGTDGEGLLRMQNGATTLYSKTNGLINDHVIALLVDGDGVVWVGTSSGGLNRIENGRVTSYTPAQGLFDSTVGNLVEDKFGNLWMGSDYGIFRVAKQELNFFAQGRISSIHSVAYDTSDGLRSRETMQGGTGSGSMGPDGRIWMPTLNGLAVVDPRVALLPDPPLRVKVESITFGGHPVPITGSLHLGPGSDRLNFRFTTASFIAPWTIKFRYRLEGYDRGWIEASNTRSAGYTNLPPGNYTFVVEAARHNGEWTSSAGVVEFGILPPWYRTRAAWLLWILAALLLTWGIVELRTRSLIRHRKQLETVVAERTAQLRSETLALAEAREELELQATHDSLTGLWNRAAILDHMEREVGRARREGTILGVVLADLDHFKQINDTRGHLCGDKVLREAAQRLHGCLRDYDFIGRYGGEEFLILMPGCDPVENTARLEGLVTSIHEHTFTSAGKNVRASCSFGVTAFRPDRAVTSLEELLVAADKALYQAKAAGRNCAHFAELGEAQTVPVAASGVASAVAESPASAASPESPAPWQPWHAL
jgi:diguanylate cyclase (GGDEF)-like protein